MKKIRPEGIYIPMVTPFKDDASREIDDEALRDLINFLIDKGVQGLVPCGCTGEYMFLSKEEHQRVVEITVDEANGRVPIFAGAGNPGTKNAMNLAKHAKDVGADGVMVITPHREHPSDEGIYTHFDMIAEEVDVPVMIYNFPDVTGFDIPPHVVSRLADLNNIVALKESTHSFFHLAEIIRLCKDKITVLKGFSEDLLPALVVGAQGGISSAYNIVPDLMVDLYQSFMRGDVKRAREIHFKLMPLWGMGLSPSTIKEALNMLGRPIGPPREPLLPASQEEKRKLREILLNLGILQDV